MGPKSFYSQNFSLFIVKFKKLGFSAPLRPRSVLRTTSRPLCNFWIRACRTKIFG